jgi:hypothetical protein
MSRRQRKAEMFPDLGRVVLGFEACRPSGRLPPCAHGIHRPRWPRQTAAYGGEARGGQASRLPTKRSAKASAGRGRPQW